jgi:hypothetical protein
VTQSFQRLVGRQGGVFTRDQALENHSSNEVRGCLRRGDWRRTPWTGLYVDGELPDDVPTLIRAASVWLGGDLVACHSTAAYLWDFDLQPLDVTRRRLHFLGPPDVDNRLLAGLQVHPSSLGTDDAVLRHGVWCTPPDRTACDVARLGPAIDGLAHLDAALRTGRCSTERLIGARTAMRGLRGVERLDKLIPVADGEVDSAMESRMRWRFIAAGLPTPTVQIVVGDPWRRWHRIDVGWEDLLLGAEFDGLAAHMTRQQLADDRDRHNWLTERQWMLLHFTSVDVYRRHEAMVETVRRQMRRRTRVIMAL